MFFLHAKRQIGWSVPMMALLAMAFGCNGSAMVPVSGKVTFEGAPVPQGTITFFPQAGGRPATGQIQSDGSYVLSSLEPGDGVPPGDYAVAIEARRVHGGAPVPASLEEEIAGVGAGGAPARIEWLVPIEYSSAQSSGLTATVTPGESQIDFALP